MNTKDKEGRVIVNILQEAAEALSMKTRYTDKPGTCDICKTTNLDVYYDMPFQGGHWATVCMACKTKAGDPYHPAGIKFIVGKNPAAKIKVDEQKYAASLSMDDLEDMVFDRADVVAADGCVVDPDGKCQHGYSSPLLLRGII